MDGLFQLIREAHRRSLWQVLSVYLVASWVALQVVEVITESAGLPDWAQPFSLILLILGLPIVLATALVQEGVSSGDSPRPESSPHSGPSDRAGGRPRGSRGPQGGGGSTSSVAHALGAEAGDFSPASERGGPAGSEASEAMGDPKPSAPGGPSEEGPGPSGARRLLTWRNTMAAGAAAFGILGILLIAYLVMWSNGIGPVGSLAAQGVFEEGDAVVLADFENTSTDETLGDMVTQALRVDLAGSSILTLVSTDLVRDALGRMGQAGRETVDADLAREVAIRDGHKAVIHGTVGSAGSGYIMVATLTGAESGSVLATFRETAKGPDEVIDAIDKLSQDIREKAGESLRSIKAEEPLETVTTSSLEALRLYAESERLEERAEYPRAVAALEEAIKLDPSFAMAYRRVAVLLNNVGGSLPRQVEMATRAFELRDRLTERERFLATAHFHNTVTLDLSAEIQAYETVLERYPDDNVALNNLALAYIGRTRVEDAVAVLERAVNGPGASSSAFSNLPPYLAMVGRLDDAEKAKEALETRYPNRGLWTALSEVAIAAFTPDGEATLVAAEAFLALPGAQGFWRMAGHLQTIVGFVQQGRIREARETARRGSEELQNMGNWNAAFFMETGRPWMEKLIGSDRVMAESERAKGALLQLLDSIPTEARDYGLATRLMAEFGDEAGYTAMIQRWQDDGPPSAGTAAFDEARRVAEALLQARDNPAEALESLNQLSREFGCPGCEAWQRAGLAQGLGRFEEARDLYLTAASTARSDFLGDPIQRVMVYERLGEVYEALGDNAKAAEHYSEFARHWADADPEFQPRVRQAREKVAQLTGG